MEVFKKVAASGGRLPLADVLRCRIRFFTEGAVLGSKAFVESHLAAYQLRMGRSRNTPVQELPCLAGSEIAVMRNVRGSAFG
jgi:hypothetical protein